MRPGDGGQPVEALEISPGLFLPDNDWKKQIGRPVPNYRLHASQGPQDTQGRDKSYGVQMNPYERPPITDWKEKTTP